MRKETEEKAWKHSTFIRILCGADGADIYIGVVGPVRTGKSTFIKRFMDLLSAHGKHLRGSKRKDDHDDRAEICANEAVEISFGGQCGSVRVQIIDCMVPCPGQQGDMEQGRPRMVPYGHGRRMRCLFAKRRIGSKKVITNHSTIGMVVTTDGSVTELRRKSRAADWASRF